MRSGPRPGDPQHFPLLLCKQALPAHACGAARKGGREGGSSSPLWEGRGGGADERLDFCSGRCRNLCLSPPSHLWGTSDEREGGMERSA